MTPPFVVRRASIADAAAIWRLDSQIFARPDQFSLRRYRYLLRSDHAVTLVAEESGYVIGSVVVLVRRASSGLIAGRIYSIAVDKSRRRAGVGARLVRRGELELRRRGASRVFLETRASSNPARKFFERLGYVVLRRLPHYYFDDDGVKMARKL